MTRDPKDIAGQRFGRLVVVEEDRTRLRRLWRCKCDCGAVKLVQRRNLVAGLTRSCGCFTRERMRAWWRGLPMPEVP